VYTLVRILGELHKIMGSSPASFLLKGLNGRLGAKSPSKTQLFVTPIKYEKILHSCLWGSAGCLGPPLWSSASNYVHGTAIRRTYWTIRKKVFIQTPAIPAESLTYSLFRTFACRSSIRFSHFACTKVLPPSNATKN
jgi:hypothetical protein